MHVRGTLLTFDLSGYSDRTAPRLWIRDEEGDVKAYQDAAFAPYFYAVPAASTDAPALAASLAGFTAGEARVLRTEAVKRRLGLREVGVVRVETEDAADLHPLAAAAKARDDVDDVLETDVALHLRYALDRGLASPCEVDLDESGGLVRSIHALPGEGTPPTHLALALEPPDPADPLGPEAPIVRAAVADADGAEVFEGKEVDLVEALFNAVRRRDPDVLLTFDGDALEIPRLLARASEGGVEVALGRDRTPPTARATGPTRTASVAGRAHIDLLKVAERDVPDVKIPTLDGYATHLGAPLEGDDVKSRARAVLAMGEALLPLQIELARMTRLPLDEAARAGRGKMVDQVLLAAAARGGILAPNKGSAAPKAPPEEGSDEGTDGGQYEGGLVLEPVPGVHRGVVALDFRSMYPSLMIARNVSPETLLAPGEDAPAHEAPEVGHRFRTEPRGFFSAVVEDLIQRRRAVQAEMRAAPAERKAVLDTRQKALKVLTNACYGYLGWTQARWGARPAAEAVTAWGRALVRDVRDRAEARGLRVFYGDTDSLFVTDSPEVARLVDEVNSEKVVELEAQDRFTALLLTPSKKRYAGLTDAGEVVVRGLEVRRGDWCALAKRVQAEVLDVVLREGSPEEAARLVRRVVEEVRQGKVPVADLVIHKTMTMSPKKYRARAAHTAAVERAERDVPGFRVVVGAKIAYVVLREGGAEASLADRTKLARFLGPGDAPDPEYYVAKQVVPAALRILEPFGWTAEALQGAPRQTKLF
ncbi:MAG TPA: DNA-directed DNA polymerase [Candidatus Thermoplasmatota archaeon]|nr:DNA-directed DNA polymerase [Candidatus Thermoplasmatota archaeon]